MFGWLNIFKKSIAKPLAGIAEHPFYNQRLELTQNLLSITQHEDDQKDIDLNELMWINIIHHGESNSGYPNCWLSIRAGHEYQTICTVAANFDVFEQYILSLEGFNRSLYWEIKDKKIIDNEVLLYKAKLENNYEIHPQNFKIPPFEQGIVLENKEITLPWVDYDQLDIPDLQTIHQYAPNPDYESKKFLIEDVQILNGLKLENIYTQTHYSKALILSFPVLRYESDLKANDPKANFYALVKHFDACFNNNNNHVEQNDHDLKYKYQQQEYCLTLDCYWSSRINDYDSQLYLTIEKAPDLNRFYVSDVLNNLVLNELKTCLLDTGYDDGADYLEVDNKFYTPPHFNIKDDQTLIWRNDEKQIVGISNTEFTRLFKIKELSSVILQIANCRGHEGRNFLQFLKGIKTISSGMSVGETIQWIERKEEIARTLNIPFGVEYFDDHY